ncbi:Origin recognition complex subunit 2 [Neolecta irregularis DAH-3]|uniref:Origin recognition complex subunit 2 n=1 Tax=Neolecta irregularis (strain DAH-3) TaxID=1198029 RepID=A0A1U7LTJ4_NEOID|nr:Origin recognition complex subunit 2 [Neolecta irregularis DAH-3]|eukprot:OLL25964.1 Origin recognition complex subunit 2 [Neolecta irregularis DAH-3]
MRGKRGASSNGSAPDSSPGRGSRTNTLQDEGNHFNTPTTPQKSNKTAGTATPKRLRELTGTPKTPLYSFGRNQQVVVNADRSARRKSYRKLIQDTLDEGNSDQEDDEQNEIVREIAENSQDDSSEDISGLESEAEIENKKINRGTGFEEYFAQLRAKGKTSNNTLSKLPQLDHSECRRLLDEMGPFHQEETDYLHSSKCHGGMFDQWIFELSSGFNILLYGYGSKRRLIMNFVESHLSNQLVVVINGYFPSINIKDILQIIASALEINVGSVSQDILNTILAELPHNSIPPLTLVIHNLDGENIRSEKSQSYLSILASHPKITLLASIDHINAPLLWDIAKSSNYNFLWHETTTFIPYTIETSFENNLVSQISQVGGGKGAKYVLSTLTPNARGIYRLLLESQVKLMKDTEQANESFGLEYKNWYTLSSKEFLVSNDINFRNTLTEFFDHRLVVSKRDHVGEEILWVPFEKRGVVQILEDLDEM